MKQKLIVPVAAALFALAASCTVTYITPISVADPKRVDVTEGQAVPASTKTYELMNDWQWGPWVIKRGGSIIFNEDGTGSFQCRIYAQYATTPEHVHFQSIQYGKDGNRLFSFPSKATGYPMLIRAPYTDYAYNVNFAYDKRHFPYISDVKFYARTRLKEEHVGHFAAKRSSFTGKTFFDPTGSPPESLPPSP